MNRKNQLQLYIDSGHKVILLPYANAAIVKHKVTENTVTIMEDVDHTTMITLLNDNPNISTINNISFEIQLRD